MTDPFYTASLPDFQSLVRPPHYAQLGCPVPTSLLQNEDLLEQICINNMEAPMPYNEALHAKNTGNMPQNETTQFDELNPRATSQTHDLNTHNDSNTANDEDRLTESASVMECVEQLANMGFDDVALIRRTVRRLGPEQRSEALDFLLAVQACRERGYDAVQAEAAVMEFSHMEMALASLQTSRLGLAFSADQIRAAADRLGSTVRSELVVDYLLDQCATR